MPKPILGYWNTRCLAQPIRLLLSFAEIDFVDKRYTVGPAPDYDKSCWLDEKNNLGLDFPNLPYYIDGEVKLSQSNAILRYIARKAGLDGKSTAEKIKIDLMAEQSMDFHRSWVGLTYNPRYEELKDAYSQSVQMKLKEFSKFLGGKDFFCGSISWIDFVMYELLDEHRLWDKDVLKNFGNLADFLDRIENIPQIKSYKNSDKFLSFPVNNVYATWYGQ